jgi:hypothetical protein
VGKKRRKRRVRLCIKGNPSTVTAPTATQLCTSTLHFNSALSPFPANPSLVALAQDRQPLFCNNNQLPVLLMTHQYSTTITLPLIRTSLPRDHLLLVKYIT